MAHIVWDWNGTLLDDLAVVVAAVNVSLAELGAPPIDADTYRDHYTRPVHLFYERLLGRRLSPTEWTQVDEVFHVAYRTGVRDAYLTIDAEPALRQVASSGATQSLLSMWWHDELQPVIRRFGIDGFMERVDGNRGEAGETKLRHLAAHLEALGRDRAVVIGDSVDDGRAALELGLPCVMYDGGSHHRRGLEELGAPVADSLLAAVELAKAQW